jgi:hypothetical protein
VIEDEDEEEVTTSPTKRARYKCIICAEPARFGCLCEDEQAVYCSTACQREHYSGHLEHYKECGLSSVSVEESKT